MRRLTTTLMIVSAVVLLLDLFILRLARSSRPMSEINSTSVLLASDQARSIVWVRTASVAIS